MYVALLFIMPSAPVPFIPSLFFFFLQDYGTFYFNLYIGNECGFGYSDDDDDYYYDDYYYDDDDRGYDCICATNSSCFVSTQTICLYPGKTIYPYTCGGSYPGEISGKSNTTEQIDGCVIAGVGIYGLTTTPPPHFE